MKEITIICCWNNKKKLDNFEKSLNNQSINCDKVFIDNSKQRFLSCSEAYNYALQFVKTQYVIFSHQDVYLDDIDALKKFLKYMKHINANDIIGVVGAFEQKNIVKTNIRIGDDLKYGSPYRVVNHFEKCFSLDECWFGGYTSRFIERNFNTEICDNWHLYAVEQCMYNIIHKYRVYVCDVELVHFSTGDTNHYYNIGLKKLSKEYAGKIKAIYTPCCFVCKTNFFSRNFYYLKNELRLQLKRR